MYLRNTISGISDIRFVKKSCTFLMIYCTLVSLATIWPAPERLYSLHTCMGRYELSYLNRILGGETSGFVCGAANGPAEQIASGLCQISQLLYLASGTNGLEAVCYFYCFRIIYLTTESVKEYIVETAYIRRKKVEYLIDTSRNYM